MPTSPARLAVVFDLDGTLVDSLPDIITSFQHGFAAHRLPVPADAQVRALIGLPLEDMYAHFAPAHVEALCAAYRTHYAVHFVTRSRPFPGAREVLATLRARGYLLAVATTKRSEMARRFVEALGLTSALDHVQGTDGFPHKPAPDVIHRALAALDARGAWMVGDTTHDVEAGRAAGLRTYAVSWGTHEPARLEQARPDVLAPDLSLLLEQLPALSTAA